MGNNISTFFRYLIYLLFQYNLEKPANEDYEEEEEDEEYAAARRVEDPEEDPIEGQYR